jgi:hypothetical protein
MRQDLVDHVALGGRDEADDLHAVAAATETIGTCKEMSKKDAQLLRAEKEIAIGSRQISPNKSRRMGLEDLSLPKTPYFRLYIDLRLQAEQGYRCYRRRR